MQGLNIGRARRTALVTIAVIAAAAVVAAFPRGIAAGSPVTGSAANGTYLALGDSVAFGYVPSDAVPAPKYQVAHSFVGYPEYLAQQLRERVWNASCPGETTTSLLTGAGSNGCEDSVGSPIGYRTLYPLHVQYKGTQMAYALDYLARHKHTQLITIDIGANDAFVCQETTQDHCTSPDELDGLAAEITQNLASIYSQLRDVAHYQGPIVALDYYSLNYADPTQLAATMFLNSVIAASTLAYGGVVADGFGAFGAASGSGGDPCAAGLLIKLPDGTCNIHPSPFGHQILAAAIAKVLGP
jgi:lysophospholipase L1-like esterase